MGKYHKVNDQWPDVLPALDGPEAISAAKRLYRFAMKRPFPGKWELTSGNRLTWARHGVFYVNPNCRNSMHPGWHDLIHMMSHYCHHRLHPKDKPHGAAHHYLEREMVAYVLKQGWLDGKLKSKAKPKQAVDKIAERHAKVVKRIDAWEAKRKRAENALKKLRRQQKYYESRSSAD